MIEEHIEICIDCGSERIDEGQCQDCAKTKADILTPDGPVAEIMFLLHGRALKDVNRKSSV